MKYNSSNKPLVCMQTQSTCYKGTSTMTVKGVLWHSTGANNPNLRRYVQPSDTTPAADTYSKAKWLEVLGKNSNNNDWNHISHQAGLNCWIGKLADGTVTTVQTMPWDYKPWGCGGGCNNGWIQFEICESALDDTAYFNQVYKEACEITAYLCKLYNINPNGTVSYGGKRVPTILCHQDSYKLGLGSNHGDIYHWFPKHGKTMDSVRSDVAALLKGANFDLSTPTPSPESSNTSDKPIKPIEPILIRGLSVLEVSTDNTKIELLTNENFNDYAWTYTLTSLNALTDNTISNMSVKSKATELVLKNLIPNNEYSLEISAEDKFKKIIKSPVIVFATNQEYPQAVEDVFFELDRSDFVNAQCTLSFTPSGSWGNTPSRTNKGYRISLLVNGYEKGYSDSLITEAMPTTKILSFSYLLDRLNVDTLKFNDIVQIGVQPWVIDEQNNRIFADIFPKYSNPVYLRHPLNVVNKIYLSTKNGFKSSITYFTE